MMKKSIFSLLLLIITIYATPEKDLLFSLNKLKQQRHLKGLQLQISNNDEVIFNSNIGQKNQNGESIDNNTIFYIASISKSFSSVALLQMAEEGKISIKQSLTQLMGFKVENPHFPGHQITLQMVLSHQSSLVECQPFYSYFLTNTSSTKSGYEIPHIKEILIPGGRFYNECLYSKQHKPGSYFSYVNLNYGIAGTILQIFSKTRFDIYQHNYILQRLSVGLEQIATFNPATIKNPKNLGVLYTGNNGNFVPSHDFYPDQNIPQRNLTGYEVGTNGVIYGPQASLRASVSHLTRYAIMLKNSGKTLEGEQILKPQSTRQLIKWRYQYSGVNSGHINDYHTYGLGLYGTTYRFSDQIIDHKVVKGHIGEDYGMLSAMYYWDNCTLTYIITGALNGYQNQTAKIYEEERVIIHQAVQHFISNYEKKQFENQ